MARAVASLGRAILRILAGRLRGSVEVRHPQIVKAGDAVRLGPHANPARAGEGPIFNLEQLALAEIDLEQRPAGRDAQFTPPLIGHIGLNAVAAARAFTGQIAALSVLTLVDHALVLETIGPPYMGVVRMSL